jgi:O-antigen biosynthesis protein
VIARDAFIHHFGGRTFVGRKLEYEANLRENYRRFRAKWAGPGLTDRGDLRSGEWTGSGDARLATGGEDAALAEAGDFRSAGRARSGDPGLALDPRPADDSRSTLGGADWPKANGHTSRPQNAPVPTVALAVDAASGGGLRLSRRMDRPRISLCMIVRDNERTLPACLESIHQWVDEMVIVDTGSVDDTPRIVESFGARSFQFPWCDDFSAARNESVKHALGEWVFWMDSDDTIPQECGRGLRALAYRDIPPHILGFTMQVHCPGYGDDGEPDFDVTMVDHVKLFRNRPDLRFDHRIHEQVLPAIRGAGGEIAWSDLYVVHSGSDHSPEGRTKKLERDLRILHLELSERPEHPFTLFNLGMTYCHASRYEEAVDYLERGIARSGVGEPHLRKEFALLMFAWMRLGRHELAMEACRRGQSLFPDDPELRFREAVALQELGRPDEARRVYLDVLRAERPGCERGAPAARAGPGWRGAVN